MAKPRFLCCLDTPATARTAASNREQTIAPDAGGALRIFMSTPANVRIAREDVTTALRCSVSIANRIRRRS